MADNYLITGYWGEPHVTAENDRGIHAAIFGAGRFVLPVGEMFRAEYIGNNTIRIYDGKLLDNGAAAGIPAGKYIDLLIPEAGQGMKRNDLIVFQYSQDAYSLVESGSFIVISGEETTGTAADPVLHEENLLSDEATLDQMALWRVPVSGATISTPEIMYNTKFAGERIAIAHSENGVSYTVDLPGIAKLYNGLEITIVPDRASASTAITLNVNGLGDKFVRLALSTNTSILVQPDTESFFVDGRPIKMIYDDKYASKGSWVVVGRQRASAQDLYGSVITEEVVNLMADGWSDSAPYVQTVAVDNVTTKNHVFVCPDPARYIKYCENGVRCTAQGAGTLTFRCETVPDGVIPVNVFIFN